MYKITFKHNNTETTLVNTSQKYYLHWEQDVLKHFIFSNLDNWYATTEVITSSPKPFESGNHVQSWKPNEFLQIIGWYHVGLEFVVKHDKQFWNKDLVKNIQEVA